MTRTTPRIRRLTDEQRKRKNARWLENYRKKNPESKPRAYMRDIATCLQCHALLLMTNSQSGRLTGKSKSVISIWRKNNNARTVTAYDIRQACIAGWNAEQKQLQASIRATCWSQHPATIEVLKDRKRRRALEKYYENHEENKARVSWYACVRYHKTKRMPEVKVRTAMRAAVRRITRLTKKSRRTIDYLGCTYHEARAHIEKQFRPGMSWENHGTVWEIDHIIPIAAFDLTNPAHQMRASHYTNLQPLLKEENRKKWDYYDGVVDGLN